MRRNAEIACLLTFLLGLGTTAWGDEHKLSPELKGRHTSESIDVIVQYKDSPVQSHRDRVAAHGGVVKQHLRNVKGLLVTLPASRVEELSHDPDVAYISPDRAITRQMNNAAVGVLRSEERRVGKECRSG